MCGSIVEFHQLGQLVSAPYATISSHMWAACSWWSPSPSCSCWFSIRLEWSFSQHSSLIILQQILMRHEHIPYGKCYLYPILKQPIRKWRRPSVAGWSQADGLHMFCSCLAFSRERVLMGSCVTHLPVELPCIIHIFLVTVFPKSIMRGKPRYRCNAYMCALQFSHYVILAKGSHTFNQAQIQGMENKLPFLLFLNTHICNVSVGAPMYVCVWVCACWYMWLCACMHVTA